MANESVDGASRAEKSHAEVRVEVTPGSRETEVISKKPLSQQPFRSASNAIREGLHTGRFFWTIEFIPSQDKILHDELHKLGGIAGVISEDPLLAGFAVTDRVVSDRDPGPAGDVTAGADDRVHRERAGVDDVEGAVAPPGRGDQ